MVLPGGLGKTCLKCNHTRGANDPGPEYACPQCGAVYAKLEAAQNAQAQVAQVRTERAEQAAWEAEHTGDLHAGRKREGELSIMAHVVYVLFVLPVGLTALVGVIIAHVMKGKAEGSFVQSHFRWQINTFWGMLVLMLLFYFGGKLLIGFVLLLTAQHGAAAGIVAVQAAAVLGWAVLMALVVWFIYRVAKGWYNLVQAEKVA